MERAFGDKAANKCIEINGSLVTIYDEEDIKFLKQFAVKEGRPVWLGLQRSPQSNVSKWSNGAPISSEMFNTSDVNVRHGEQICEAIENNTWKGFNCSDRKPFMCSRQSKFQIPIIQWSAMTLSNIHVKIQFRIDAIHSSQTTYFLHVPLL